MATTESTTAFEEEQTPQSEEAIDSQQDTPEEPQQSEPVTRNELQQELAGIMNQLKRVQGITDKGMNRLTVSLDQKLASIEHKQQQQEKIDEYKKDLAALEDEPEARRILEKYGPQVSAVQQPQQRAGTAQEQVRQYVQEFVQQADLDIDPDSADINYSMLGANPSIGDWAKFQAHLIKLGSKTEVVPQEQPEQQSQPQQTKSPPSQAGPDRSQSLNSEEALWDAFTSNRINFDSFKEKYKGLTGRDP
jgi:hypothetical protein